MKSLVSVPVIGVFFLAPAAIAADPAEYPEAGFVRGDANADGALDISDAVRTLRLLFLGDACDCLDAADTDASGNVEITDAIGLLGYLFLDGPPPDAPYPDCGLAAADAVSPGCATPFCSVGGRVGDPVWKAKPSGCMQCEPCPGVEEITEELESMGIEVLAAQKGSDGMMHCMACSVCSSGIVYLVLVSPDDASALGELGWTDPTGPRGSMTFRS